MKRLNYIIQLSVIAIAILLAGCEDFLEEENRQSLTDENAFGDTAIFDQFVVNAYQKLRNTVLFTDPDLYGTDIVTRNSPIQGIDQLNDYVNLSASNGAISTYWTNYYNLVNAANLAISRAGEIPGLDETEMTRGLAEVKFLRAYAYFHLVEHFGGVPLILEEITTAQTDFIKAGEQQIYAQILTDLEEALPGVDDVAAQYGRVTKDAVRHLMAKVLLTRGYKDFAETSDFARAASLAETVIANRNLVSDFESLVDINNQRNDEVILAVLFGSDPQAIGVGNYRHLYFKFDYSVYPGMIVTPLYNRGFGNTLTPFYFSLFEGDDQRDDATFRRVIYALEDSEDGHINAGDTAIYFPETAWTETDKQAVPYVVINPDEYFKNDGYTNVHYPMFKKFDDPGVVVSTSGTDPKGERDAVLFRLGETILLGAEAHLKAGDAASAASLLTSLRSRAGISTPVTAADVDLDFILDESARELTGEISRWMELKRTGKLVERVLAHNPHAALNNAIREFNTLRPIPQSEIDLSNGTITQNEGYTN